MEEMLLSLVTFEAFLRLPGSQLGQPELCQKAPVSCRHTSSQLSNPLPPDIIYAQRNDPSQPLSQPTSRTLMTLRVSLRIYNSIRYSHLLTDRLALPAPHTHTHHHAQLMLLLSPSPLYSHCLGKLTARLLPAPLPLRDRQDSRGGSAVSIIQL